MLYFQQASAYLSKVCARLNPLLLKMLCWNLLNLSQSGIEQQILLILFQIRKKNYDIHVHEPQTLSPIPHAMRYIATTLSNGFLSVKHMSKFVALRG